MHRFDDGECADDHLHAPLAGFGDEGDDGLVITDELRQALAVENEGAFVAQLAARTLPLLGERIVEDPVCPLLLRFGDQPLAAFVVRQVLIQDLTAQLALHRFGETAVSGNRMPRRTLPEA
ncbi:hypothetical protein GCM10010381_33810 [Streptomyces xantholiticus]|nr:hypothetical protein GCM10010381_33810 [Streptomyces xantholiticus]